MTKEIRVIVICPDCGKQIAVTVDGSSTVTVSDEHSTKPKNTSGWPPAGESQQEYFGTKKPKPRR